MTQFETLTEFIRQNPGTTLRMIRRYHPEITHEFTLLKRIVDTGLATREKVPVKGKYGETHMVFAYTLTEASE